MGQFDFLIGIGLSCVGAVLDNLGITAQKYSHRLEGQKPLHEQRAYVKQPWWLMGMAVFVLGNLINAAALSFAAQTLFAAIGGITLVANAINSNIFLGETFTRRIAGATFTILVGSSLAVAFGPHGDDDFDVHELGTYFDRAAIAYISLLGALMTGLQVGICILNPRFEMAMRLRQHMHGVEDLESTPLETPLVADTSIDSETVRRIRYFLSFAYPAFAGLLGSVTLILAKSTAVIVRSSFKGDDEMDDVVPYFLIAGTLVTGAVQIHWINLSIKKFDQLVAIPAYYVCYTTFSIFGGIFYLHEATHFNVLQWVFFPLSTVITFVGVYFITTQKHTSADLDATTRTDEEKRESSRFRFATISGFEGSSLYGTFDKQDKTSSDVAYSARFDIQLNNPDLTDSPIEERAPSSRASANTRADADASSDEHARPGG